MLRCGTKEKRLIREYTLMRIDADDVCEHFASSKNGSQPPPLLVTYHHDAQLRRAIWISPHEDLHRQDHVVVSSHAHYAPFLRAEGTL